MQLSYSYSRFTAGVLYMKTLTLLTESKKTNVFAYFISEYKEWKDVCKGRNNHILSSYKSCDSVKIIYSK